MSYVGVTLPIPLGELGLRTDAPMTSLPANALIKANNVSLYSGKIEKALGSLKYSQTPLTAAVVGTFDWWPDSLNQRLIALTADGNIWRDTGDKTFMGGVPMRSVEIQKLAFDYQPVGGSFKLNFAGTDTPLINWDANIPALQTAIQTIPPLASIGVAPSSGGGLLIKMYGTVGNQPMITSNTNTLVSNHVQTLTFSQTPTVGNFRINYGDAQTVDIPYTAIALTVQNVLRAIPELAAVTVTGSYAAGFVITLVGVQFPQAFTTSFNSLVNGTTPVVITRTPTGSSVITISESSAGKSSFGVLTPNVHMTQAGQEESGKPKKLFIFTGTSQIQVITGDGGVTTDIGMPSPDWANGNYPTYGLIYQNRLCVFGCPTNPHQLYFSLIEDHENFIGNYGETGFITDVPPTVAVFPGENDGILTASVFKGTLFLFKEPFGVYLLNGQDPDVINWQLTKFSDSFGVQSPHSVLQVLTDLIAANSFGSYTSVTAADTFGDFEAGDILANHEVEEYVRSIFNQNGLPFTHCVYYPEKKVAYFTGQSSTADVRDQMLVLDVAKNVLRFTVDTKEQPNCLALRRDVQKILRPMYGDKQGFIWLMDQQTYNREAQPYLGEFQTAYTDFSNMSPDMGGKNKIFDFVEVNYVPTGNNSFYCDVFVDGDFRQTLEFKQVYGAVLDEFVLDEDVLAGAASGSRNRKRLLSCTGTRISFRFYNNSFNEGFKIERVIVSFRASAEQVYGSQI